MKNESTQLDPSCSSFILHPSPLAVIAVPAALVRQSFAAEVGQQRLPATAAALRVADHLLMLAQVALLAVAVGLPRPRQLVARHVRPQQAVAAACLVANNAPRGEQG